MVCSNSTMPCVGRDLLARFGNDLGMGFQRIAVKPVLENLTSVMPRLPIVVPACIVHAHADHDPERVEAVEQALAEFGILGEMRVICSGCGSSSAG